MLDFPKQFDINEWSIILIICISIALLKLPKRIPKSITVLLGLLSISIVKILDHTKAVPPFELYDLIDTERYELFDLILYACYPPFGFLSVFIYM